MSIVVAAFSVGLVVALAGVFATLVGIGVAAYYARKQLSRRRLSRSLQITQLVSIHSEARDRIQLYFEGEEINRVHLIKLRLRNSGNRPIREADFERPITIGFREGTPLTVETTDVHPSELKPVASLVGEGKRSVQLTPLLLNPGDGLSLKILVRDFGGEVSYDYRIVGVTELVDADRQANRRRVLASPFVSAVAAVAGGLIVASVVGLLITRNDSPKTLLSYASLCPDSVPACASPLWNRQGHGTASTGNVSLGRNLFGQFDPSAFTMALRPGRRRAWLSVALTNDFSYVSGQVSRVGCSGRDPISVTLNDEATPIWSRILRGEDIRLKFRVSVRKVDFLLFGASTPPGSNCRVRLVWSDLRFR